MPLTTSRRLSVRHLVLITFALLGLIATTTGCTPREASLSHSLVNADRAAAGLPPLLWDENAATKAQTWAERMAGQRRIFHSDVTDGISGGWQVLGENVGYAGSVNRAQELFMKSATHRAAILNPRFTSVGIGVAKNGNEYYVSQVFRG